MRKYLLMLIAVLLGIAVASAVEQKMEFGKFGTVTLYYTKGHVSSVVLFISGDGGWNLGVVSMARALASLDALVIGIDITHYLKKLEASSEKCSYPAADFEMLSKYVQKKLDFSEYLQPVIVGYSSGATLAYALIVQAPQGTFKGAVSMGFCPDLPLIKPFCKGSGLTFEPGPHGKGYSFLPDPKLQVPWIAFQGTVDQVCSPDSVVEYVKKVGMAQAVLLPKVGHGFSVEKNWMPQFKQAFLGITEKKASQQIPQSAEVSDLPVVEVPAGGPQKDFFAVLISGDGGWAGIDRDIAAALSREGVSVIGLNSLKYFWKARTPEGTARDLDRIIRHYCAAWNKEKLILVGYSFGADVLPFLANRLGQESFNRIQLMAFLGLSPSADFEFHLTDWLGGSSSPTAKPILPEIEKLKGRRMICFYGTEEKESLGKSIDTAIVKSIPIEGGHHFGNKYDDIAATILRETQNVK